MNNDGTIAAMSAILAVPVLLFLGLAVDLWSLWVLRQRMQWAVDTAALLGASQSNTETGAAVTKDAKELFWASYGAPLTSYTVGTQVGFLGSSSAGATVSPATAATSDTPSNPYVTVTASARLPTMIMRITGQNQTTVTTTSVAAVPHRVEMTLVLDNSLSMGLAINGASSKLAAMQTAANNLLTTILGSASSSSPNVSIGIVPFAGAVNVGNGSIGQSFLKSGTLSANYPAGPASDRGWRGCVQARAYASSKSSYDTTEDAPLSDNTKFDPYYYLSTFHIARIPDKNKNQNGKGNGLFYVGDNDWQDSAINDTSTVSQATNTNYLSPSGLYYGPNLFCPHSSLVTLTNDKAALSNSIGNMQILNGGGTVINQGLQWGWFTLSPLWTAWGLPPSATGAARPAAYADNGTTKIIVLMTDGVSEVDGIDSFYGAAAKRYGDQHSNCDNIQDIYPECTNPPDSWYTSYGRVSSGVLVSVPKSPTTNDQLRSQAKVILRARLQTLCSNIKAKNIALYTILFHGSQDDQVLNATSNGASSDLSQCATNTSHFFDSQSASAINTAFQKIAQDINDLRIVQ